MGRADEKRWRTKLTAGNDRSADGFAESDAHCVVLCGAACRRVPDLASVSLGDDLGDGAGDRDLAAVAAPPASPLGEAQPCRRDHDVWPRRDPPRTSLVRGRCDRRQCRTIERLGAATTDGDGVAAAACLAERATA